MPERRLPIPAFFAPVHLWPALMRQLRRWAWVLLLPMLTTSGLVALAQEAPLVAADPALEARMLDVTKGLRCLVCQNETIAESQADLAVDLRQQVRDQLRAGRTPQEIRDYMVARYGEFVLYKPPFSIKTVLLWLGPFVLLLLGFFVLWRVVQRRPDNAQVAPDLDPQAQQRARELLGLSDEHPPS